MIEISYKELNDTLEFAQITKAPFVYFTSEREAFFLYEEGHFVVLTLSAFITNDMILKEIDYLNLRRFIQAERIRSKNEIKKGVITIRDGTVSLGENNDITYELTVPFIRVHRHELYEETITGENAIVDAYPTVKITQNLLMEIIKDMRIRWYSFIYLIINCGVIEAIKMNLKIDSYEVAKRTEYKEGFQIMKKATEWSAILTPSHLKLLRAQSEKYPGDIYITNLEKYIKITMGIKPKQKTLYLPYEKNQSI